MAIYNGVIGIDEAALNGFIQATYKLARTEIYRGSVPVANLHLGPLTSIEYDIAEVPRVVLAPSSLFRETQLAALGGPDPAAHDTELKTLVAAASKASFDLTADHIMVNLRYSGQDDTKLEASLRASLAVTADSGGILTPQLAKLVLTVPNEPVLSDILNKGLAPYLQESLKNAILTPIKIPPLGYGKVFVSAPTVITGQGRLLATTAIAPAIAESAPLEGAWPSGRIFAGVDLVLLNELVKQLVPTLKPVDGFWSQTFRLWFIRSTLKADYSATVRSISLDFVPGQPDQLRGIATIDTHVHLYAKNIGSWTGSGPATATVRAQAVVGADRDLAVKLVGLDDLSVKLDFHNTPAWMDKYVSNLIMAMRVWLAPRIAVMLAGQPPIKLAAIPSFPLAVGDETLEIGLKGISVAALSTPDGKTLLGVSGTPDVQLMPIIN
jgi:hypothetical protein